MSSLFYLKNINEANVVMSYDVITIIIDINYKALNMFKANCLCLIKDFIKTIFNLLFTGFN